MDNKCNEIEPASYGNTRTKFVVDFLLSEGDGRDIAANKRLVDDVRKFATCQSRLLVVRSGIEALDKAHKEVEEQAKRDHENLLCLQKRRDEAAQVVRDCDKAIYNMESAEEYKIITSCYSRRINDMKVEEADLLKKISNLKALVNYGRSKCSLRKMKRKWVDTIYQEDRTLQSECTKHLLARDCEIVGDLLVTQECAQPAICDHPSDDH